MTAPCRTCEKYRRHLVRVAQVAAECNRAYDADEDTAEAYGRLRRIGEGIGRLLKREPGGKAKAAAAQTELLERGRRRRIMRDMDGNERSDGHGGR